MLDGRAADGPLTTRSFRHRSPHEGAARARGQPAPSVAATARAELPFPARRRAHEPRARARRCAIRRRVQRARLVDRVRGATTSCCDVRTHTTDARRIHFRTRWCFRVVLDATHRTRHTHCVHCHTSDTTRERVQDGRLRRRLPRRTRDRLPRRRTSASPVRRPRCSSSVRMRPGTNATSRWVARKDSPRAPRPRTHVRRRGGLLAARHGLSATSASDTAPDSAS